MDRATDLSARNFRDVDEPDGAEQLTLFERGPDMSALLRLREQVLGAAVPPNTALALECDWRVFTKWCATAGRRPLPATRETVELFAIHCVEHDGLKVNTVTRRVWSIRQKHEAAGLRPPSIPEVMSGLARKHGRHQTGKAAVTIPELRKMVATLDGRTFAGARDRCVLILGFSTGLRSASLVGLSVDDVRFVKGGAEIRVRKSKTDQEGHGLKIGIVAGGSLDAVAALQTWFRKRGTRPGSLFVRTAAFARRKSIQSRWVWHVVKTAAKAAGLDPARFGSHSLRAGMITALDDGGASVPAIMTRTGHTSFDTVAKYIRGRRALDPLAPLVRKSRSR